MFIYTVIVTFNSIKWIDKVINSLNRSSKETKMIIVDNGSRDGTTELIDKNHPKIQLVKLEENLGFSKANNLGIEIAINNNADFVFLLNHDAWVEDDTIDKLTKTALKNPEYGVFSPIHLNGKGDKLDENFSYFVGPKFCPNLINDFYLGNKLKEVYESKFVNAAAWLISRRCLEKVGGFNPIFQMYGEDDNYVQRLKYHSFKLGIVPHCKIFHDREARPLSIHKKNDYENYKRAVLLKYSDPNNSKNIIREYRYLLFKIIKQTMKFNLNQVSIDIKKIFFISKNLNQIKHNQQLSINSQRTFVKNQVTLYNQISYFIEEN